MLGRERPFRNQLRIFRNRLSKPPQGNFQNHFPAFRNQLRTFRKPLLSETAFRNQPKLSFGTSFQLVRKPSTASSLGEPTKLRSLECKPGEPRGRLRRHSETIRRDNPDPAPGARNPAQETPRAPNLAQEAAGANHLDQNACLLSCLLSCLLASFLVSSTYPVRKPSTASSLGEPRRTQVPRVQPGIAQRQAQATI